VKVYVVRHIGLAIYGVYGNEKMAHASMNGLDPRTCCTQEIEVHQPTTWTVWSKPSSAEARSAASNEGYRGDFQVRLQPSGGYIVNVTASDIREALDVGESAFRMHQISNQQENSK
jgi:hypothetical protein